MIKNLNIDINSKILKAKSLNDYIFDVREPLINYTYFNECVKLNKTPEYLILDNHMVISNFGGYPSITIPSGFINNMHIGVCNTGRVKEDDVVLNIANM